VEASTLAVVRFAGNYLGRSHPVLHESAWVRQRAFTLIDRWWCKRLLGGTYVIG
jgi:hypothetical protein